MEYYLPQAQEPLGHVLVIRVARSRARTVIPLVASAVREGMGPWAEANVALLSESFAPALRPWRLTAALFSALGLLALVVAAVGTYSTLAYMTSHRTHELGVRIALGAQGRDVIQLVVSQGVRAVAIGVALGLTLAVLFGRLIASLLYETSPRDPTVLGGVVATLLLVAAAACVVPSWRAVRVDPLVALRSE